MINYFQCVFFFKETSILFFIVAIPIYIPTLKKKKDFIFLEQFQVHSKTEQKIGGFHKFLVPTQAQPPPLMTSPKLNSSVARMMYNDTYPPLQYHVEQFQFPKNPELHLCILSSPSVTVIHPIHSYVTTTTVSVGRPLVLDPGYTLKSSLQQLNSWTLRLSGIFQALCSALLNILVLFPRLKEVGEGIQK